MLACSTAGNDYNDILCVLHFLLCMFLLYVSVLLPVGVIKDINNNENSNMLTIYSCL